MSLHRASNLVSLVGRVLAGVGNGLEAATARAQWSPILWSIALGAAAGAAAGVAGVLFAQRRLDRVLMERPATSAEVPDRVATQSAASSEGNGVLFEVPFE